MLCITICQYVSYIVALAERLQYENIYRHITPWINLTLYSKFPCILPLVHPSPRCHLSFFFRLRHSSCLVVCVSLFSLSVPVSLSLHFFPILPLVDSSLMQMPCLSPFFRARHSSCLVAWLQGLVQAAHSLENSMSIAWICFTECQCNAFDYWAMWKLSSWSACERASTALAGKERDCAAKGFACLYIFIFDCCLCHCGSERLHQHYAIFGSQGSIISTMLDDNTPSAWVHVLLLRFLHVMNVCGMLHHCPVAGVFHTLHACMLI